MKAFLVEVVVNADMNQGELQKGWHSSEAVYRSLSPPERKM